MAEEKDADSYLHSHTGPWCISVRNQHDICSSSFRMCSHIFDCKGTRLYRRHIRQCLGWRTRRCQRWQEKHSPFKTHTCACSHRYTHSVFPSCCTSCFWDIISLPGGYSHPHLSWGAYGWHLAQRHDVLVDGIIFPAIIAYTTFEN